MQSSGRVDRRNFARVPSSIEQSCGDGASPVSQEREKYFSTTVVWNILRAGGRENILLKEFSNCLMITHLLYGKWSFILVVKLVSGDKNKGKFSFSWKTDNFTFKTVSWNVPLIKISILTSLMSENAHWWQSQSKSWKWAEFRFLQEFLFVLVSNVQLQFSWYCMKLLLYCVIVWKHPLLRFLILCGKLQNPDSIIADFKACTDIRDFA